MSGRTVILRGLVLGQGLPKICAPIAAREASELVQAASRVSHSCADLAEWRLDWFSAGLDDPALAEEMLTKLRRILGEMPLLLTVRTQHEGGEYARTPQDYAALLIRLAQTGLADCLDVELSAGAEICQAVGNAARAAGCALLLSSHDFASTPGRSVLMERYVAMRALGADIAKLAVMPRSARDVAALLDITAEITARADHIPLVTMSMSDLGLVSRLTGEVFGSAMTFGSVGQASAPGQIDAALLREQLLLFHQANPSR